MPQSTPDHPYQPLLEQRLPQWARHAGPEDWQALRQTLSPYQDDPAIANAAPGLREAVINSQHRLDQAQTTLARSLRGLKQIAEFAEPLLARHLLDEHGFTAPLRDTELVHARHVFTWQVYVTHHHRQSLLEAALQNFPDGQTFSLESAIARSGDIHVTPTKVTGKTTLGDSETLVDIDLDSQTCTLQPLPLDPEAFAHSCRSLDLGQRYQEHLDSLLGTPEATRQTIEVLRERLRLDSDLAYLRQQVDGAAVDTVKALLDGPAPPHGLQLSLFGITLHDVLVIAQGDAGLLLYLPGQPEPLRHYPSLGHLQEQLCTDLLQADWRARFLRYVRRDTQASFIDRLRQNLDATGESAMDQAWPLREGANLHLATQSIDGELFAFLQREHLARLKAEARQVAVPSADADEQLRQRRIDEWESLGMTALMLAGFFVPAIGTLMLAITACQLLDEAYEGWQAWQLGDRHQALHHLEVVGINLALIGGLHMAGKAMPKLLGSPLLDTLEPVRIADGTTRLWSPELAPYRSPVELPTDLQPNALGQYQHDARHFIRLDGRLYEQRLDTVTGRWRLLHPSDAEAWQPPLAHNDEGAWHAEHEQPHSWDGPRLVRRLGPWFDDFADAEVRQAMQISGTDEQALLQVYLGGKPTPPLLADSLARLRALRMARAALAEGSGTQAEAWLDTFANSQVDSDPLAERLYRERPQLGRALARRLTARLGSTGLGSEDTWPAWLQEEIAEVERELPLTRTLEALSLAYPPSSAGERLLLAAVQRLPRWPADLRLEIRAGSPDGSVLEATASAQGKEQVVVLKSASGYEAFLGERPVAGVSDPDLCRAVVAALPVARREALGLLDGADLRARLLEMAASDRQGFQRLLGRVPDWKWSRGLLRGGDSARGYPRTHLRSPTAVRYRRLFPRTTETEYQQLAAQWRAQGLSPTMEVDRLDTQLGNLRRDLHDWAGEHAARRQASQRVESAWRRTEVVPIGNGRGIVALDLGGLDLADTDLADLPLPDGLGHVNELRLSFNPRTSRIPPAWLERMPTLNRLMLTSSGFTRLPRLPHAETLQWLDIDRNPLVWSDTTQLDLDRYANLRVLDLSYCPLGRAPNLALHPELSTVYMTDCGLASLPEGLHTLIEPLALDFAHNPLVQLPTANLLPARVARALRLEGDGLGEEVWRQIGDYYQATGIDLLIADLEYEPLLANAGAERRAVWERLPLSYRRDLRNLMRTQAFERSQPQSVEETWRRLTRIDQDIYYRQRALAQPAARLLDLPMSYI